VRAPKVLISLLIILQPIVLYSQAAELKVAVASNFAVTAQRLVDEYVKGSDDKVVILLGSTGKRAAQIQYGLAVDVFLAADQQRPQMLEQKGFAVAGSGFDYALGQLVLWSKDASLIDQTGDVLAQANFNHLAIANPKLAPYGQAALQALEQLGVRSRLESKLVRGDSVAQVFQFVSSGNAELGLLALAQIQRINSASYWLLPSSLYAPIVQSGVVIKESASASAFVDFLQSETALLLIEQQGYLRP